MRYLLILSLSFWLLSCTKESDVVSNSIEGSWELSMAQTGMAPSINYDAGNGNILLFTEKTYKIFENNQLIKSGSYTIVQDTSVKESTCLELPADKFKKRLLYDSGESKLFIQIENNKLTTISGCFALDAGSYKEYLRHGVGK